DNFSSRLQAIQRSAVTKSTGNDLTRFNLDFPGGTPKELVAAIDKAMNRPLNAIVPDEFADTKLPPLKMNSVNVAQLFEAVSLVSHKTEAFNSGPPGYASYSEIHTSYGFRTQGTPTDDSIWYFYVEKPALPHMLSPPKACRFYPLGTYLEQRMTVDDITTAIQTGWKMMGDTSPPTISFHKDTKLLIAVGEPSKLQIIDDVLKALQHSPPKPVP